MAAKKKPSKPKKLDPYFEQAQLAKAAIRSIDALCVAMGLGPTATRKSLRPLMGHASTPKKLVDQVAATVEQFPHLLAPLAFDPDLARTQLAFALTFGPVAAKAEELAQRIRDAILAAKSGAGESSLAVYAAMKGMVRTRQGTELRDSFDAMKKIMKERRTVGGKKNRARAARAAAKAAKAGAKSR